MRRHRACHVALLLRVQPVRAQEGVKLPAVHVQVDVDLRGRAVLVPEERDSVVLYHRASLDFLSLVRHLA